MMCWDTPLKSCLTLKDNYLKLQRKLDTAPVTVGDAVIHVKSAKHNRSFGMIFSFELDRWRRANGLAEATEDELADSLDYRIARERINSSLIAKLLIVGWENIQLDDGLPLEFSEENAKLLMEDDEIFVEVIQAVYSDELFRSPATDAKKSLIA